MTSWSIGERIRANCQRCGKKFNTTIISASGNHKNAYCRACKHDPVFSPMTYLDTKTGKIIKLNPFNFSESKIPSALCSRCNKRVMVWGDLAEQLCISCDELQSKESKT